MISLHGLFRVGKSRDRKMIGDFQELERERGMVNDLLMRTGFHFG